MRKLKALSIIFVMVVFVGAIGCSKKEKLPEEPAYPVRAEVIDGVEILVSPGFPRDGREVCAFEEELNIGVEEGDEHYQLYRPQDIKVTDNGDIYVIDWREDHLRVYDKEGKYLRTVVQKGRGPGEFETPASFDFLSDGRVVILDGRNRQVSILDKNGVYQSGFKVEGYCSDLVVDGQDQLYFEKNLPKEVDVVGVTQIIEDRMNIYRAGLNGKMLLDYGVHRGIKMSYTRTRQGSMSGSSPYAHTTVWTVDDEGKLYLGYNEYYRLDVFDPEGESIFGFGREFVPIKYENYRGPPNPEFWSAFSRFLIFDDDGNLWLWHHTGKEKEEGYEYDVFSPDGIYAKQVVVPHRIHRIKDEKAYCIIRNEEGFSFIKRFRFIQ
ncbi:MAG: 6-bladed beta-propeller [Candidatus Aminicenantes bacterium]|nr:MAG: 6-bladed beta-propeller [Candidatus Aminicenantes bacterium]